MEDSQRIHNLDKPLEKGKFEERKEKFVLANLDCLKWFVEDKISRAKADGWFERPDCCGERVYRTRIWTIIALQECGVTKEGMTEEGVVTSEGRVLFPKASEALRSLMTLSRHAIARYLYDNVSTRVQMEHVCYDWVKRTSKFLLHLKNREMRKLFEVRFKNKSKKIDNGDEEDGMEFASCSSSDESDNDGSKFSCYSENEECSDSKDYIVVVSGGTKNDPIRLESSGESEGEGIQEKGEGQEEGEKREEEKG